MAIEAPGFIKETADCLRQRAMPRRNAIEDAGLLSRLILAGAGVEGLITGNVGLLTATVLIYPINFLVSGVAEMICDVRDYAQQKRERRSVSGLLTVVQRCESLKD